MTIFTGFPPSRRVMDDPRAAGARTEVIPGPAPAAECAAAASVRGLSRNVGFPVDDAHDKRVAGRVPMEAEPGVGVRRDEDVFADPGADGIRGDERFAGIALLHHEQLVALQPLQLARGHDVAHHFADDHRLRPHFSSRMSSSRSPVAMEKAFASSVSICISSAKSSLTRTYTRSMTPPRGPSTFTRTSCPSATP